MNPDFSPFGHNELEETFCSGAPFMETASSASSFSSAYSTPASSISDPSSRRHSSVYLDIQQSFSPGPSSTINTIFSSGCLTPVSPALTMQSRRQSLASSIYDPETHASQPTAHAADVANGYLTPSSGFRGIPSEAQPSAHGRRLFDSTRSPLQHYSEARSSHGLPYASSLQAASSVTESFSSNQVTCPVSSERPYPLDSDVLNMYQTPGPLSSDASLDNGSIQDFVPNMGFGFHLDPEGQACSSDLSFMVGEAHCYLGRQVSTEVQQQQRPLFRTVAPAETCLREETLSSPLAEPFTPYKSFNQTLRSQWEEPETACMDSPSPKHPPTLTLSSSSNSITATSESSRKRKRRSSRFPLRKRKADLKREEGRYYESESFSISFVDTPRADDNNKCPECGNRFKRSEHLKRHLNSVHHPQYLRCEYSKDGKYANILGYSKCKNNEDGRGIKGRPDNKTAHEENTHIKPSKNPKNDRISEEEALTINEVEPTYYPYWLGLQTNDQSKRKGSKGSRL